MRLSATEKVGFDLQNCRFLGKSGGSGGKVEVGTCLVEDFVHEGDEAGLAVAAVEFTFPDDDDMPTLGTEGLLVLQVTGLVACEFLGPEGDVAVGDTKVLAALVTMPETAVDKYDGLVGGEDEVGGAGEVADMDAVPEAVGPEEAAHEEFGAGVFAPDTCHDAAACGGIHEVGHVGKDREGADRVGGVGGRGRRIS